MISDFGCLTPSAVIIASASACAGEQLVAFLLSALLLSGLWLLRMLVGVLPPGLATAVDYACPASHFVESAARAVIDLRDGVYFALLVVFGLGLSGIVVGERRWR